MSDTNPQDLWSFWQRSMDQGMEAWRKLVEHPQTTDPLQFWKLLVGQSLDAWTQALQQGGSPSDVLARWKRFMDEAVETWSKVLEEAMETETFAAVIGGCLDQYLNTVGPLRKGLQIGGEEALRAMNLPSRQQVTGLASQMVSMDTRLEAIEDRIEQLAGILSSHGAPVEQAGSPRTSPARPPRPGRNTQRTPQREA